MWTSSRLFSKTKNGCFFSFSREANNELLRKQDFLPHLWIKKVVFSINSLEIETDRQNLSVLYTIFTIFQAKGEEKKSESNIPYKYDHIEYTH